MAELLKRVLHHVEGEEITQHETWFSGEDKPRTVTVRTCGTDRWIGSVHERQVLTAFDAIALIHLALVNYFDTPTEEQEQALVEGWALELIKSAQAKEVMARDPFTLLPFGGDLESLEWGLSMSDADSFITARGMKWTFSEVAQQVYEEEFGTPANESLKAGDVQANEVANSEADSAVGSHKQTTANLNKKTPQPRDKTLQQMDAIVNELERLGYTPLSLPALVAGQRSAKADARESMDGKGLFTAPTAFENAWQMLTQRNVIKNEN